MKLKEIVMATTLTAGIVSAMADSPDFTWFVASKIVAVFFFVLFFILAGWERLAETTAGKKIETFFESVIANLRRFFVIVGIMLLDIIERIIALAIVGIMLIGMFIYAVILTPIVTGFVLWLIAYKLWLITGKAYKKIFS